MFAAVAGILLQLIVLAIQVPLSIVLTLPILLVVAGIGLWQFATETALTCDSLTLYRFRRKVYEIRFADIESCHRHFFVFLKFHMRDGSEHLWYCKLVNPEATHLIEYATTGSIADKDSNDPMVLLAKQRWKAMQVGCAQALDLHTYYRIAPYQFKDHPKLWYYLSIVVCSDISVALVNYLSRTVHWVVLTVIAAMVAVFSGYIYYRRYVSGVEIEMIEKHADVLILYNRKGESFNIEMGEVSEGSSVLSSVLKFNSGNRKFQVDIARLIPTRNSEVTLMDSPHQDVPIIRINRH